MRAWGRLCFVLTVGLLAAGLATRPAPAEAGTGNVVGWGINSSDGQTTPPAGYYVAIAAGGGHSLALKADGSIVGWGRNYDGQASPPAGNDFVAIAAGESHSLALKADGSIAAWGQGHYGQTTPPGGNDYVAIAAGWYHGLALKAQGSIVGWGLNVGGQATPPSGNDFVAIAGGPYHSLALKADGSIVRWGENYHGATSPPSGGGHTAIAAGYAFGVALRTDGSLVGWGSDSSGKASPPAGKDYVAISASSYHGLALKADGSIVGWGENYNGQASPPPIDDYYVAISAGEQHSLALMGFPPSFGEFTALTPSRVLDTRHGVGTGGVVGTLGPRSVIDVQITGRGGVPAVGVDAVVMNVTAVAPTAWTYLTVYPTGIPLPNISNLNTTTGHTQANLATVRVGDGGKVSVYNWDGTPHVLFDVAGYYTNEYGPDGARFRAIDPVRIADTRHGIGGTPLGPDETRTIRATGYSGIPVTGPTAVVLNVTVDAATAWSFLTISPADVTRPNASNLNYVAGDTVANQVIVRVPADGMIDIYNAFGTTTVIVDLVGYYEDAGSDYTGRFLAFDPFRQFDTRVDDIFPPPGDIWDGDWIHVWWDDDPYSATVVNVTVTQTHGGGYIVTYPYPGTPPNTSTVNYGTGDTVANHAIVRCGPEMAFLNVRGTTHLIVDIFGVFT